MTSKYTVESLKEQVKQLEDEKVQLESQLSSANTLIEENNRKSSPRPQSM